MTSSEGGEGDGPARRAGLDLARSTELEICNNVEDLDGTQESRCYSPPSLMTGLARRILRSSSSRSSSISYAALQPGMRLATY